MYYAHTSGATGEWHKLADHLQAVAERARSFAEPFSAGEVAYWVGLLHDLGKFSPGFQAQPCVAEHVIIQISHGDASKITSGLPRSANSGS